MRLPYAGRPALRVPGLLLLTALFGVSTAAAQTAFINEIHYDDVDGDDAEAVELAVPTGTDVSTLVVTPYNGNGGAPYGSAIGGGDFTSGATAGGYTFYSYVFPANGLQNGAPDGLALSTTDGALIEFVSYEGSFTAVGGPADGEASTDIGVSESNATPEGQSLQLTGPGSSASDFSWTGPVAASFGAPNAGQTFGGAVGTAYVVDTPLDVVAADGLCSLREAVQAANTDAAVGDCAAGAADGDTITFAPTVAAPILLTLGELTVTDDLVIDGSLATGRVTIDADGTSRIFDVDAAMGAGDQTGVSFTALVLQNGDAGAGGSAAPDAGGAVDLKPGSDATFTDVDVTGSVAGVNGGGIHGAGDTDIVITTTEGGSSLISNNEAQGAEAGMGGGGVWGAGTVTISGNVTVDGNRATGAAGSGGGVFNFGGVLDISDATVSNNTANRAGGGVEDFGDDDDDMDVTLTNVRVVGNSIATAAPGNGGGFHSGGGDATITGGVYSDNTAVEGGGLWSSGTLTVTGAEVRDNTATGAAADQGGGGLYNDGGTASISGSTFLSNEASGASGSGGAILNSMGVLTVRETSLRENSAARAGGAVEDIGGAGSVATFTQVTFAQNDAGDNPGNGGAVHVTGAGTVRVDSSTVQGNVAGGQGGGLWNFHTASMDVTYTTVGDNSAPVGGGLYQQGGDGDGGVLMFANSTASNNEASIAGGGVFADGATVQIENSTVSGNSAQTGAGVASRGGRVLLSNATVAANTASGSGGGLANLSPDFGDGDDSDDADAEAASVSPDNTIVADNSADGDGDDLLGPIMSRGHNLFETTAGATVSTGNGASGDITGEDPELGPLADNGGPTFTHAIAETSPAVNVGRTALEIDQRGVDRVATPDIGAFESNAAPTPDEEFAAEFADGEDMKMSALAPNPFTGVAFTTVAVRQPQTVRVALYDVMGREVRVLHDGPVAGGAGLDVEVDASGLASGVYVLTVRGESVSGSQRVTVVR